MYVASNRNCKLSLRRVTTSNWAHNLVSNKLQTECHDVRRIGEWIRMLWDAAACPYSGDNSEQDMQPKWRSLTVTRIHPSGVANKAICTFRIILLHNKMGWKCVVLACRSSYDSNKEMVSLFKVPKKRLIEGVYWQPNKKSPGKFCPQKWPARKIFVFFKDKQFLSMYVKRFRLEIINNWLFVGQT